MDCSLPGSSLHGILQARILEWVAISFSRGSSWPRNRTWISCIAGRFFTDWAIREAQHMGRGGQRECWVGWRGGCRDKMDPAGMIVSICKRVVVQWLQRSLPAAGPSAWEPVGRISFGLNWGRAEAVLGRPYTCESLSTSLRCTLQLVWLRNVQHSGYYDHKNAFILTFSTHSAPIHIKPCALNPILLKSHTPEWGNQ